MKNQWENEATVIRLLNTLPERVSKIESEIKDGAINLLEVLDSLNTMEYRINNLDNNLHNIIGTLSNLTEYLKENK